jgi:hypothetical protein
VSSRGGAFGLMLESIATDKLLLDLRPPDDVHVEQGRNGAFTATLDIAMWQKRIRAVGSVSVEFIASGEYSLPTFLPLPFSIYALLHERETFKSTNTIVHLRPYIRPNLLYHRSPAAKFQVHKSSRIMECLPFCSRAQHADLRGCRSHN